jgi:ABC-type transporter Mla subunit MlaD
VSDYETTQRKRNILVGLFVLLALFALGWLIFRFGDLPGFVTKARSFQVFVQFPTAPGVQKDTPIRFCGYQIGRVTKVKAPEIITDIVTGLKYHQIVVVLSIDKKYVNIPSNVEVKLMTRGLGSSYIELKVDPAKLPSPPLDPERPRTKFLVNGMLLQGSTGITSEFFPEESQKKLDELVDGIKSLVSNADDILGDPNNKENFRTFLANLSVATDYAEETVKEFQKFAIAGTNVSEEISGTVAELRLILEKINAGEGSAAMLVNDGRLYENLLENTRQLESLMKRIKEFVAESREKGLKIKW